MFSDYKLVKMVILEIAKNKKISLMEAMDIFYNSEIVTLLEDKRTGLYLYSPIDIAKMVK